jgi:hypothetical protein
MSRAGKTYFCNFCCNLCHAMVKVGVKLACTRCAAEQLLNWPRVADQEFPQSALHR